MSPPQNNPDREQAIRELVAGGFTPEAAAAIVDHYGDTVELADGDLDITVEKE